jgi:hypothetical protein
MEAEIFSVTFWYLSINLHNVTELIDIAANLDSYSGGISFEPRLVLTGRDSTVGIATGYGMDDRGVGIRVPVGSRIFSSPGRPDRL